MFEVSLKKLSLMAYIRMILISMIYIIVGTIFYNKAIGQYYYIFFMNMRRRASFSSREKESSYNGKEGINMVVQDADLV